jgi:hypothetical protein
MHYLVNILQKIYEKYIENNIQLFIQDYLCNNCEFNCPKGFKTL